MKGDMEMARVEASVVVNRPVEEVFAFAINPENDTQWESGILEVEQTSEGSIGVGTTLRGVGHLLGQRIEFTSEVTEYQPDRRVDYAIAAGPMHLEESYTFEPVEGGTRVTLLLEGEPGGFFKLAEPIVVRMYQRQMEGNLANLKDILEARA
jgi:uncharacterized protein YndB with AHSA1/START domain